MSVEHLDTRLPPVRLAGRALAAGAVAAAGVQTAQGLCTVQASGQTGASGWLEAGAVDISTFYALFSATCFTLVGLWWGVIQRSTRWVRDPAQRRAIGGVYLAFLLPGLMGLFAQVGGVENSLVWRLSFVLIAAVGSVTTARLFAVDKDLGVRSIRAGAAAIYALVVIIGAFPQFAGVLGLQGLQAEALLLVILVALGHALVWRFMVHDATAEQPQPRTPSRD